MADSTEELLRPCADTTTLHLVKALREDFNEWKRDQANSHRKIQDRITQLEDKALHIPEAKDAELIKEAAAYYKAKRQFRERLVERVAEKGILGLVIFLGAAAFFYFKQLITNGT